MTKQIYVGEFVTPWLEEEYYSTRYRWSLFVPVKRDGTPDKRYVVRRGKYVLIEHVDHFARLYENNVLVEERHDCEPGSWDISQIDQPQYGSRLETNDAHR